jgi:hypothetical protein
VIELVYLVPLFVLLALLGFVVINRGTLEHQTEILKVDLDTARLEVELLREDLRDIHVRRRDLADDLTRERSRADTDRKLLERLTAAREADRAEALRLTAENAGYLAAVAELRAENAELLSYVAFGPRRDSAARAGSDPDARGLPPELGAEELSADEPAEPSEEPCPCGRCRIGRSEVVATGGGWSSVRWDDQCVPVCLTCSEWDATRANEPEFRACLVCGTMTRSRDVCNGESLVSSDGEIPFLRDVTP